MAVGSELNAHYSVSKQTDSIFVIDKMKTLLVGKVMVPKSSSITQSSFPLDHFSASYTSRLETTAPVILLWNMKCGAKTNPFYR